jgi:acetyl esterase/lipase
MEWFWDNYVPNKADRVLPLASPLQASLEQLKGLPPTLLFTNENDVLRDEGEAYAHKLMQAGVSVTAMRLIGMIHDSVMLNAISQAPAVRAAIALGNQMLRDAFSK